MTASPTLVHLAFSYAIIVHIKAEVLDTSFPTTTMLSCLSEPSASQDLAVVELDPERGDAARIQAELLPYLKQYGSTIMAYSTLQKGLRYFTISDMGYIAYAIRFVGPPFLLMREPLVLGDPVCHPKDRLTLLAAFLRKHSKAIFLQVSIEVKQMVVAEETA